MVKHKEEYIWKWEQAVEAWKKSGLSKKDYCNKTGMPLNTLGGWQCKLNNYYKRNNPKKLEDFVEIKFDKSKSDVKSGIRIAIGSKINIDLETGFNKIEFQKAVGAVLEIL